MKTAIQNIDVSILAPKEQEELFTFYQYLVFKTKQMTQLKTKSRVKTKTLPKAFYSPIKINTDYKFNRDEIYRF